MDDVIGWCGFCESGALKAWSGFTVQVNVSLKKSVRVGAILKIEGKIVKREGARKIWISCRLVDPACDNAVHCEGDGLYLLKKEADNK
jgi:hypothetical protein